jgi:protein-tyrosine phosphatase
MILDCNEIIPDRLWVGRFLHPQDVALVHQLGITSVVSLQSDEDLSQYNIPFKKLLKAYQQADVELVRVPILDFNKESLANNIENAVAAIEEALVPRWAKVYLHCTAGINRGPTLAAAYLMKNQKLTAKEAYKFVMDRRHCSPYLDSLEFYQEILNRT